MMMRAVLLLFCLVVLQQTRAHPCTFLSPLNGDLYDFSPLSQCVQSTQNGYDVIIDEGDEVTTEGLILNICAEITTASSLSSSCSPYAGAILYKMDVDGKPECLNLGTATSGTFKWVSATTGDNGDDDDDEDGDHVLLSYTSGEACPFMKAKDDAKVPIPLSTSIRLVCSEDDDMPIVTFLNRKDCTYRFRIESSSACPLTATSNDDNQVHDNDKGLPSPPPPPPAQRFVCPWPEDVYNVFVIPHSHDDVGWLYTPDYYYETYQNGPQGSVHSILDATFAALQENPQRKFTQVEQDYFSRWWGTRTDTERSIFRSLVANGQIEFAVGGWVMHDEACPSYSAMIDQMTEGQLYLKDIMHGIKMADVSYGWQIDPFGHSAFTPDLDRMLGIKGHVMYRMDTWLKTEMKESDTLLEFNWKGIPTHILNHNYFWPWGTLGFGSSGCYSEMSYYAETFLDAVYEKATVSQTPALLLPYGSDFALYKSDELDYPCLDLLFREIQANFDTYKINIGYATPRDFFHNFHSFLNIKMSKSKEHILPPSPVENSDFFPYSDNHENYGEHFWTGFYSSRSALKRASRDAEAQSRLTEILYASARVEMDQEGEVELLEEMGRAEEGLTSLRRAVARVQHHDGITGTARPDVVKWYHSDLYNGTRHALSGLGALSSVWSSLGRPWNGTVLFGHGENMADALAEASSSSSSSSSSASDEKTTPSQQQQDGTNKAGNKEEGNKEEGSKEDLDDDEAEDNKKDNNDKNIKPNETKAKRDMMVEDNNEDGSNSDNLLVTIYNSLAWSRQEWIQVPLHKSVGHVTVTTRKDSIEVRSEIHSAGRYHPSYSILYFEATVKGLSYTDYIISNIPSSSSPSSSPSSSSPIKEDTLTPSNDGYIFDNDVLVVRLDKYNGLNKMEKGKTCSVSLKEELMMYNSVDHSSKPNSGAYIFRPADVASPLSFNLTKPILQTIYKGPLVTVWHQEFPFKESETGSARQTFTFYKGVDYLEVDFTIDGLPVSNSGREFIVRFKSDIQSNSSFYTDVNGVDEIKREYVDDILGKLYEAIARNYYPVVYHAGLNDSKNHLSFVTDTSHGFSSLVQGHAEFMLHRRTEHDDGAGLTVPMQDTATATSKLRVTIGNMPTKDKVDGEDDDDEVYAPIIWKARQAYSINFPLTVWSIQPYNNDDKNNDDGAKRDNIDGEDDDNMDDGQDNMMPSSPLSEDLPPSIHLLSYRVMHIPSSSSSSSTPSSSPPIPAILIRLKHIYAAKDDAIMGQTITLDLKKYMPSLVQEFEYLVITSLSATKIYENRGTSNYVIILKPHDLITIRLSRDPPPDLEIDHASEQLPYVPPSPSTSTSDDSKSGEDDDVSSTSDPSLSITSSSSSSSSSTSTSNIISTTSATTTGTMQTTTNSGKNSGDNQHDDDDDDDDDDDEEDKDDDDYENDNDDDNVDGTTPPPSSSSSSSSTTGGPTHSSHSPVSPSSSSTAANYYTNLLRARMEGMWSIIIVVTVFGAAFMIRWYRSNRVNNSNNNNNNNNNSNNNNNNNNNTQSSNNNHDGQHHNHHYQQLQDSQHQRHQQQEYTRVRRDE